MSQVSPRRFEFKGDISPSGRKTPIELTIWYALKCKTWEEDQFNPAMDSVAIARNAVEFERRCIDSGVGTSQKLSDAKDRLVNAWTSVLMAWYAHPFRKEYSVRKIVEKEIENVLSNINCS